MARLNAWIRLGIVATILWVIGGTLYFHISTMNQRIDFATNLEKFCIMGYDRLQERFPTMDYSKQRDDCGADTVRYLASEPPASRVFETSLFGAAICAAVAWVIAGIAIVAIRWILAGRKQLT